ncbi:MAG: prolipoprotein diacylglyceryl transferase [Leptospira sp.]|nr:prolipoprotein diacylglyceryl transferase [Leptospira sp.]
MIWNVDPVIIDFGIVQLRYYGICWMLGLFLGLWMSKKTSIVQSIPDKKLDHLFLIIVISIVIFAHLVHLVFYEPSSF